MSGQIPAAPEPTTQRDALNQRTDALLRRLVRKGARTGIQKLVARTRPEDLAAAMEHLTWDEQRRLWVQLHDHDYAADVLAFLSDESSREITKDLSDEQVVELLDRMEPDDATDVVAILPLAMRERVLNELHDEESSEVVRGLLQWPPDSAGGIMSPEAFLMQMHATCGQAIGVLQQHHAELESIYYVYVVNDRRQLQGVVSLRALLVNPPRTKLASIMTRDVITVPPTEDQEEVARFVARYDLLAIPVVDEEQRILGLVTVDDVVDVIREEAAEDMMLMAGVSEGDTRSIFRQTWHRAGWLMATIFGGILAAEIIGLYEATLESQAILAGFIPVIMGMGGNVGIQSATLAVRGLAVGQIQVGGTMAFVWREARVGLMLGVFYALLLGLYVGLRFPDEGGLALAGSVASSILLAIFSASGIGAAIPVMFDRLGADPAIATGPFVTTLVDLLGIVIYFNVAKLLLGL